MAGLRYVVDIFFDGFVADEGFVAGAGDEARGCEFTTFETPDNGFAGFVGVAEPLVGDVADLQMGVGDHPCIMDLAAYGVGGKNGLAGEVSGFGEPVTAHGGVVFGEDTGANFGEGGG